MAAEGYAESKKSILRDIAKRVILQGSKYEELDAWIPCLGLNLFDRFFSRNQLPNVLGQLRDDIVLAAHCCLVMAWRQEDLFSFSFSQFVEKWNFGKQYMEHLVHMEVQILKGWKPEMRYVSLTPICFVKFFLRKISLGEKIQSRIPAIIMQALLDISFTRFRASVIAASAVLTASELLSDDKLSIARDKMNILACKYVRKEELEACLKKTHDMCIEKQILHNIERPHDFGEWTIDSPIFKAQALSVLRCPGVRLDSRPVIGILTHPFDGAKERIHKGDRWSNIPASYVKLVESGGARVIPLVYNEPENSIFEKLDLVNGVLFTGGFEKEGLYYRVAKKIFERILEKNDEGDYFPLFAICLGLQLLTMFVSKDNDILESSNTRDYPSTLQFTGNSKLDGTVFEKFPDHLLGKLGTDPIVMENHRYCLTLERMRENIDLSLFFKILTTTLDRDDKVYVSTMQAYDYPVTAVQWHPEKAAFEWAAASVFPHSEDAVGIGQHVANFIVREARKSPYRPSNQHVLDKLIYNHSAHYRGHEGVGYDQIYHFHLADAE